MLNSEIYTLDDNNDYEVYDTIEENNNTYLLLAQVDNVKNIIIRNLVYDQNTGKESVERLTQEKFNEVFNKFIDKNKDLFS